jgi:hypothetical protein
MIFAIVWSFVPATWAQTAKPQSSDKALPIFDIDETSYNFGDTFIGEDLSKRFTVRNLGAAPLLLADSPILADRPTVGSYHQPAQQGNLSLQSLLRPAGRTKAALPYT